MARTTDDIIGAVRSADDMPYGPARTEAMVRLLEEVDRDALHETESYVLISLVEAHFFSGDTPRAVVVFSRLRRLWSEHPERFDEYDQQAFFAAMNWMVGGLQDDPSVPAEQILPLLDDMDSLAAIAGFAGDAAAYERLRWSIRSEAADVQARFDTWRHAPRTTADCEFCERVRVSMVLVRDHRYDEIVTIATAPGHAARNCQTDPADMWSMLAQALLETGDAAGAARVHREFEAALPRQGAHLTMARGRRIATLGRGGALAHATAAIEEDQALLSSAVTVWLRLFFLTHVAAGTSALVRAGLDGPVRLAQVPATTIGELAAWARTEAADIAQAFGDRAGGSALRDRTLAEIDRPLPTARLDFSVAVPTAPDAPTAVTAGAAADDSENAEEANTWRYQLAAAERLVGSDLAGAAAAYGRAAALADADGALAEAGFAYAELAQCADRLRDPDASHDAYGRAVARLEAADVDPVLIAPVLEAWAPVADERGDAASVTEVAERLTTLLAVVNDDDVSDERLRARRVHRRVSALAALDETRARLTAEHAPDAAFDLAMSAVERHRASGKPDAAAEALWLAARIRQSVGASDAPDVMRAAFEVSSGTSRGTIGAALVAALQAAGRHGDADDVLGELGRRR